MFIYQDPARSIEERIQDLLGRMTLEEKVGQMCQLHGRQEPETQIRERHVGSFLHTIGEVTIELQKLAEQTRLGIPLIFGIDAIHGHAFWPEATVFPTQLALSCSWNPRLLERVGQITAKEVSATGIFWTFSPVLGTARDLRWGRIDETFGEDPYLVGMLGAALIRGYQGDDLSDPHTILACAKHYAGYPGTQGGRDSAEADITRRNMRAIFLKPFHEAAKTGCGSFMTGYHTIDGLPCTADRWLLQDVLKEEWGTDAFVVTDWQNVDRMHREQMVCATIEEASKLAAKAGNDMMMMTPAFYDAAIKLVNSGDLDVACIDEAVRRVLRAKFKLGLFDHNRYPDLEAGKVFIGCGAHRAMALESAYQSIVLLKNAGDLLPLDPACVKRIAVLGPNADDVQAQLGDWVSWSGQLGEHALTRKRESVVTVLDGIRSRVGSDCQVDYFKGCEAIDPEASDIAQAAKIAEQADVAVVVVGDVLSQTGECRDRADLNLSGKQQDLVQAAVATGTPTVVVLINSKPLAIPWIAEHVPAIVEAWNPGLEGGTAVAGILFGDRVPSGKLTMSFPYHVGQLPVYYNQVPGWHGEQKYVDMPRDPLFVFGYGLSYTTFAYQNLQLSTNELNKGETLHVSVDVKNTGARAGTEIVQLYVNDVYSSVTTPVKELQAFERMDLEAGETRTAQLEVAYEQLALVNRNLDYVVEAGEFEIMVGGSSRAQDLLSARFEVVEAEPLN
ncbi:MAG: glycoside hydrolase family 3 C-terminal domain-containing protein [Anaerolineae bacterium]|nr:glycoside hydrolase family 3 C-terminal domain-containing protein [Anaerolineae bacterium]